MWGVEAPHARRALSSVLSWFRKSFGTLPVLHEDEHILAVYKPCGMPVHGGAHVKAQDTVLGQLQGSRSSLHLVHRLDAGTTGVLVMAKSKDVARLLERAFSEGLVKKTYVAAVVPEGGSARWKQRGTIEMEVGGKLAKTAYVTMSGDHGPCRLLELTPTTGRTHQLRIHCAKALGAPILGDTKYGRTRAGAQRELLDLFRAEKKHSPPLFLHCATLRVPHIQETERRISLKPALFTRIDARPLPGHFVMLQELLHA